MIYFKRLFSTINFFLKKTTLSHCKLNKESYGIFFFNSFKVATKHKKYDLFLEIFSINSF